MGVKKKQEQAAARRTRSKAYVRIELPGGLPWRKKAAETSLVVEGATDFEMWANLIRDTLTAMGYTHPAFVMGFFYDVLNKFPEEIRKGMAIGIFQGLGTIVEPTEGEEEGITIRHEAMYPPLVAGETTTESGIVIPDSTRPIDDPDRTLVLPAHLG